MTTFDDVLDFACDRTNTTPGSDSKGKEEAGDAPVKDELLQLLWNGKNLISLFFTILKIDLSSLPPIDRCYSILRGTETYFQ